MPAQNMKRRYSHKKSTPKLYTKGELNQIIDSVLHPFFNSNQALIAIDALLHGLIEQNVSESTYKFIRYSLPKILKKATSESC
jgi:hypothetical protein